MIRLEPKSKSQGLKRSALKRKPLVRKPPKVRTAKPRILREWARKSALKSMSKNIIKQRKAERILSQKLLEKSGGFCMRCGKLPDFRGLSKHELVFRSRGGNPLDENNTILICGKCHAELHGIKELPQI